MHVHTYIPVICMYIYINVIKISTDIVTLLQIALMRNLLRSGWKWMCIQYITVFNFPQMFLLCKSSNRIRHFYKISLFVTLIKTLWTSFAFSTHNLTYTRVNWQQFLLMHCSTHILTICRKLNISLNNVIKL